MDIPNALVQNNLIKDDKAVKIIKIHQEHQIAPECYTNYRTKDKYDNLC